MRNWWIWLVMVGLVVLAAACGGQASSTVTECDFGGQTAVTLQISDENGEPQRLVRVEYRLNNGAWEALPESVNERAVLQEGPGTYQFRLEKSGYAPEEFVVVAEAATDGSCQVTSQTVAVAMTPLVCPATELAFLEVAVAAEGEAVAVTAVTPDGRQELTCVPGDDCQQFQLPLSRPGSYTIDVTGLAGLGPMTIEDGIVTYSLRPRQVTLRQSNVTQRLDLPGAESVSIQLMVAADEIGCPLAELRTMTSQTTPDPASDEPFPPLDIFQENNLLLTDLSVPECEAEPQPFLMTYEATLPNGTPLRTVSASVLAEAGWQTAECGVEDGRFLCTAVIPNPLVGQPYAFKIVAAGDEYVGMSLPLDNLCLVFD